MYRQVKYSDQLPPSVQFPEETLLLYDSILTRKASFKKWSAQFKYKVALKSGEELKTLKSLNQVLTKITKLNIPQTTQLCFVAVGGGSISDFVGFLASIYLRGRKLVLIPSTWLAAVDSAHGGKTGLNFQKTKNQIGSFYPAEQIIICKDILASQPPERLHEALGEIIKIAVIQDKKLFQFLEANIKNLNTKNVFKKLPSIIKLKYQVVENDPFEKNGYRRLLNLGHTVGHIIESHEQWPHGVCVLLGMQFSLRWSFERQIINETDYVRISELLNLVISELNPKYNLQQVLKKINTSKVLKLLSKDKKLTSESQLDFIFIKKLGHCVRLSVYAPEVIAEIDRQIQEF